MSAVAPFNSRTILGLNQEAYQQLRLAASLNLRRQLLLAVCDDVALQQQLAKQLDVDLQAGTEPAQAEGTVVSFYINPHHPSPLRPILDWLKAHRLKGASRNVPLFQILGIDQLTRQSPALQNQFLLSLSRLELLLSRLDISLLLWIPRPWLHKIRRCAPSFWRLRSRLFEFAGEPAMSALDEGAAVGTRSPIEGIAAASRSRETGRPAELTAAKDASETVDSPAGRSFGLTELPVYETTDLLQGLTAPLHELETEALQLPVPVVLPELHGEAADSAPVVPAIVSQHPQLAAQWQQIQALAQQQAGPLTLAQAQLGLGQICRDLIEAGSHQPELLDFAIAAYDKALPGLSTNPRERCDGLNDLGSLYWLRSQVEAETDAIATWLQQSVEAYQQALQVPAEGLDADSTARINSNLGTAYSLLAGYQDPVDHFTQAVRAYHRALTVRPASTHPFEYASLQNSLGATHWQLSQLGNARHHLHRAIHAYTEALQYRSADAAPQDYAMLQNNLGIAYWSLAQYERPGFLLEQAIQAYRAALAYRTLASDPAGCAATYNNLGTAYWDLAQQQQQQPSQQLAQWQQSVAAYEESLMAAQKAATAGKRLSFDVWATFHSAGVVHDHIAQRLPSSQVDQRAQHLQRALELYNHALEGWQSNPERMALLQSGFAHNVRSHFEILGMEGQNKALSQVPRAMLPEVLAHL